MSERERRPRASVCWQGSTVLIDQFPISIGRDGANQVVIAGDGVSRRHLVLDHDGQHFVAIDDASTNGTYLDGRRVHQHRFDERVQLKLGRSATAQMIEISPLTTRDRDGERDGHAGNGAPGRALRSTLLDAGPAVGNDASGNDAGLDAPTILPRSLAANGVGTAMPPTPSRHAAPPTDAPSLFGAMAGDSPESEQTATVGDVLRVHDGERSHAVYPGRERVIGRDRACDIVVDHPLASRRHAVVRYDGSHWYLDDLGSAHGTFVDGRKVTSTRLAGAVAVWLGGADVGARITVSAPGARRRSVASRLASRRSAPIVAIVAIVAAIAGVLALVVGPLRHPGSAPVALLQQATVRIETPLASGSGTIVTTDGLVLTNAHVAAPDAVGQGLVQDVHHRTPPRPVGTIEVYITRRFGETAGYRAQVVAADGYLDLAVLRLVATLDGGPLPPVKDLDLAHVGIAKRTSIVQGQQLRVLGFPTVAGESTVTLTQGAVSGFSTDARLGGQIGFIVTDAPIGHGNSGGLAADSANRLVGVPTARRTQDRDAVTVLRPADLALPMLKAVRDGKPYVSPFVKDRKAETFDKLAIVAPTDRAGADLACVAKLVTPQVGEQMVAVSFTYASFPADRQDMSVTVRRADETTFAGAVHVGDDYPSAWNEQGCATVTVKLDKPLAPGAYVAELWLGGNLVLVKDLAFTVGGPASASGSAAAPTDSAVRSAATAPTSSAAEART